MKLSAVKLLLFLMTVQSTFGCAHYFRSGNSEQFYEDIRPLAICIVEREVFVGEKSFRITSEIRNDIRTEILDKIRRKYPNLVNDCSAKDKYLIAFKNSEKIITSDHFILTLGIIPIVAKKNQEVEIFYNEKSIYKATDKGTVVASIFFVPFFFLHKSQSDTLFDLLNGFFEKTENLRQGVKSNIDFSSLKIMVTHRFINHDRKRL